MTEEELRDRLMRRPGMSHLTAVQAEDLLLEAADVVRDHVGWHLWPSREETITVDARGGTTVPLPTLHLTDLTSVATARGEEWVDVEGVAWSEGGWLLRHGCWPDGPRSVRASIVHGYAGPPGAVPSVLIGLAARTATAPAGVSSEQSGGESLSYATAAASDYAGGPGLLSPAEMRVLDRYRIGAAP
ncbi:hypothetical protein [Streptomyces lonarensis]|uniref:Head-to-tail adaptor n=1 Tax=Streptomyces lonarensis TaxID=700599 RepID=A0A7X6HX90_9ACTN|nr:hypothetical protein [Streptomyces lonarensis]NJQ04288.1 hypothetical protein [Streptomyces lonarensis]